MYVFDLLIFNEGRSLERMTYSTDNWQLILAGHDRAFGTGKGRPRHLESVELAIGPGWKNALSALDDELLESEFSGVLDSRRQRALAARRDTLVAD